MKRDQDIYTNIEMDSLSASLLNALDSQVAVLDDQGTVIAYNNEWHNFRQSLENTWCHPGLGVNILKNLQAPLADGNDFALRFLIGIKEVLGLEVTSFESKCFFKDVKKAPFWFKVKVSHLQNQNGAIIMYDDISDQIKSTRYLKETQQKFESHFHNSLYGILVADENKVIIEANKVACKLLETTIDDVTFSNVTNFLDLDMDVDHLQKKINRDGNMIGEIEITTANGNTIPVEMSVTLFRNEDGKYITSWAFNDISEKKITEKTLRQTEQQYKLQFNNTLEGIIIGRPDGQMLNINPAACDILGYTQKELEGKHRDIIFDTEHPLNKKALQKRRKDGSFVGEVVFTHREGYHIPVEIGTVIFAAENGSEKSIINIKDISERKSVQQQLIDEKEFTESAISILPTAFFVFSTDGEMIRWNDMLEDDLGYSARELARTNVMKLIHPHDRYKLREILGKLSGEKVSINVRCISKNGEIINYLLRGTSFDQNGKTYIVGGGLNQNDLLEIDTERKRNAELLTQLFHNSPIGIVLIDADGKILESNDSFEKTFEYKKEELRDLTLTEAIVPDYMDKQAQSFSNQSFTGQAFQSEAIRITKNGKEVPVLIGGVPVEVDNEVIAIYGMYVDISERKKLEDQILDLLETEQQARLHMQDMFEEAPTAIAMLEGDNHTYSFVNDKYKELICKENVTGKTVSEVLPELNDQGLTKMLDTCYNDGKTHTFNERAVYFHKENSLEKENYYLNFVYKPLHDDKGDVYGIFVQAVDVTEQVKARNLIEKSLQEKETLLTEVHHRVKNNLAIISGLLELEVMSVNDKKVSKHLDSTHSRINTIAKVHELLYQSDSLSHVSFKEYIKSVLSKNSKLMKGEHPLISDFELDDVHLNVNQAIPVGILLNEILEHLHDTCIEPDNLSEGQLIFKMREEKNNVIIDLLDPLHRVLDFQKPGSELKHTLRNELIEVLLTQIYGDIKISEGDQSLLTLSFPKSEAKGPHNALYN
ncbi:PAS domain S-box protein [Gracilimonas sp. Q87]|uniref:PAS domain S-box protein n=1 Tax=Gracilimonas sp. Q87 TaxID=3384766 RepID=UPI00398454DC